MIVWIQSGKNGIGTIIPENIITIAGAKLAIPSPETVHIIEMLMKFVIAQLRMMAPIIVTTNAIAAAGDSGAVRSKNNAVMSSNGKARRATGAVLRATARLNQAV